MDELEFVGGGCAVAAGLDGLDRGVEGGHLGAAGDELGGQLVELGVKVGAEVFDGVLEAIVGGDLFALANLDGLEVGEDGVEEEFSEGIHRFIHEQILMPLGIGCRITGMRALVMGPSNERPEVTDLQSVAQASNLRRRRGRFRCYSDDNRALPGRWATCKPG